MRLLDIEMICSRAMALQRNVDPHNLMVRELTLRTASLFVDCGAELFSSVILKSNLHRDLHKLMHHSWMDAMYCGLYHGLRLELSMTSSATSEMWTRRFWFIQVSVDSFWRTELKGLYCYLHGCLVHVFHESLMFRWKTLPIRRSNQNCVRLFATISSDQHQSVVNIIDDHKMLTRRVLIAQGLLQQRRLSRQP